MPYAEHLALNKSALAVERALEEPRRMQWLVGKTAHVRGHRADQTTDVAAALIKEEGRLALECKQQLEAQLGLSKALLLRLTAARDELARIIKRESLSLDLTTETFTARQVRMLDPVLFPISAVLFGLHAEAQSQREAAALLLGHCSNVLLAARRAAETAIRDTAALDRKREVCADDGACMCVTVRQGELLVAKASVRTVSATLRRAEDQAAIRREVHLGPREGRFATCAEKPTRPLV